MTRAQFLAAGVALAGAVVCGTAVLGGGAAGGRPVMIVHLLAAVPLAVVLSTRLPASPWWALGGIAGAAAWAFAGPVAADGAGLAAHVAGRMMLCVGLVLPWAAAARAFVPAGVPTAWPGVLAAAAVGLAVPGVHTSAAADAAATEWADFADRNRVDQALDRLELLNALGKSEVGSNRPPVARLLAATRAEVAALARTADGPVPTVPPGKIAHARTLARLGRLDAAADLLRPLAETSPEARGLLATVDQAAGRLDASDAAFRALLDSAHIPTIDPRQTRTPAAAVVGVSAGWFAPVLTRAAAESAAGNIRTATDGLAFNARQRRDFSAAVAHYERGLAALPGLAAYFHFQLGRTHAEADDPAGAEHHFREAARLAPSEFAGPAAEQTAKLRRGAFGCSLLGR